MDLNRAAAEQLTEVDPEILLLEPRATFDKAVVGWVTRCGQDPIACYDYEMVMDAILDELGKDSGYDKAVEHFSENVIGMWHGHRTPCFLFREVPK